MRADRYDERTFLEVPLELMFLTSQHEIHLDVWEEFLEFGHERVGVVIPECELLLLNKVKDNVSADSNLVSSSLPLMWKTHLLLGSRRYRRRLFQVHTIDQPSLHSSSARPRLCPRTGLTRSNHFGRQGPHR